MFFIAGATEFQRSFQFYFPDQPDGLTFKSALEAQRAGKSVFADNFDVYIFITAEHMKGNLFFVEIGPLVHITTNGWQENFSPPSVFEYLFHSIMCGSIYAFCDSTFRHHEEFTMGCQFEYTRVKEIDRIDIALGYICQEHEDQIAAQLGVPVLTDVKSLFKFEWLGEANKVGTVAYKMKDLFSYDLRKDSGFKKRFFERAQQNIDGFWFDMAKEVIKGIILIVVAFLLFKFGWKQPG
jgi:hypothetical protein